MSTNQKTYLLQDAYQEMENYFFSSQIAVPINEKPRLIFVFSSPGVGKSQTIKPILNKSFGTQPVNLEIDELKTFIPEDKKDDAKIADMWFQKIVYKALSQRRNIVIFRQRNLLLLQQTKHILEKAKELGYQTEISCVALDARKSRLSLFDRYEKACMIEKPSRANYPRKPDIFRHYVFYKALPIALHFCSKLKQTDVVNVYNRDGLLLSYIDNIKHQASPLSPLEILHSERTRPWTQVEIDSYNKMRDLTLKKIKKRGKWKDVFMFKLFVRSK